MADQPDREMREETVVNKLEARKLLINIHLYLAAFLAPVFLLVAITGGLHIAAPGEEVTTTKIELPAGATLDPNSETFEQDVRDLLAAADVNLRFEYMKGRGTTFITRPTSRTFAEFKIEEDGVTASLKKPNLQYAMMELHKGHGPKIFRTYSMLTGLALFFVVVGGLAIGLLVPTYRKQTIITAIAGSLGFIILGLVL